MGPSGPTSAALACAAVIVYVRYVFCVIMVIWNCIRAFAYDERFAARVHMCTNVDYIQLYNTQQVFSLVVVVWCCIVRSRYTQSPHLIHAMPWSLFDLCMPNAEFTRVVCKYL